MQGSYETRVMEVQAWQRYYGMEPRTDSRLTFMYANGDVPWHPAEVARELVATDYIFKHTLYSEVIQEFMRHVAAELRRRYALSWTATWEIVRFYAPPALKLLSLLTTGTRIPPVAVAVPNPAAGTDGSTFVPSFVPSSSVPVSSPPHDAV